MLNKLYTLIAFTMFSCICFAQHTNTDIDARSIKPVVLNEEKTDPTYIQRVSNATVTTNSITPIQNNINTVKEKNITKDLRTKNQAATKDDDNISDTQKNGKPKQ